MTIKALGPFDAFRYALLGQGGKSNRAYTLADLIGDYPAYYSDVRAIQTLWARRRSTAWVCRDGGRVLGLATASRRSGPRSWEITHLSLGSGSDDHVVELLDRTTQAAASNGAQRVFLRLLLDDPLVSDARRSGFFPCAAESLVRSGPGRRDNACEVRTGDVPISHRAKAPRDDHGLFRLYNAAVPQKVRQAVGMTFDQWASSHERSRGASEESVIEADGTIVGWLLTTRRAGVGRLEVMVGPDAEARLRHLVDVGLGRLRGADTVYCLVPEYQDALRRLLPLRGFSQSADFVTLVRSTAARVKEEARATVAAA